MYNFFLEEFFKKRENETCLEKIVLQFTGFVSYLACTYHMNELAFLEVHTVC